MLVVTSLVKEFGPTRALDGLDLSVTSGEVHAVVGENGAGKSTLMNILSGIHQATSGTVMLDGKPVAFASPIEAAKAGVAMIHQELNLIDHLSVSDNIWLGREIASRGVLNRTEMTARTRELLAQVSAPIEPSDKISDLSLANRQLVEIAKAVSQDARLLIMDEPTAVLTSREKDALFALIASLNAKGVTILYVSHLLDEVRAVSNRITVMRDGRAVSTLDSKSTTSKELADRMVGRELGDFFPAKADVPSQAPLLEVTDLSSGSTVRSVSFAVSPGEIVGLAGLVGAGRTESMEALLHLRPRGGAVSLRGKSLTTEHPWDAVAAGLAYVSEDRKGAGLHLTLSIQENTILANLAAYAKPIVDRKAATLTADSWAKRTNLHYGALGDPVSSLSGGNQQKVALSKWLETKPSVLLLDEPTRGVDVGAKREIYDLIQTLAADGLACVVASSEMQELIGLCHRIVVLREGKTVGELRGTEMTEENIMAMAAGVTA